MNCIFLSCWVTQREFPDDQLWTKPYCTCNMISIVNLGITMNHFVLWFHFHFTSQANTNMCWHVRFKSLHSQKKRTFFFLGSREMNCIYIQGIIIITAVRREWKSWWVSDVMILVFNGQKGHPVMRHNGFTM